MKSVQTRNDFPAYFINSADLKLIFKTLKFAIEPLDRSDLRRCFDDSGNFGFGFFLTRRHCANSLLNYEARRSIVAARFQAARRRAAPALR